MSTRIGSTENAEGVHPPVSRILGRMLRRAVLDHAVAEHRQHHIPLVHIGWPGTAEATFPVRPDEPTDHALRSDIVVGLRARAERLCPDDPPPAHPAVVWLTRAGEMVMQDIDAAWLSAARQAYAEDDSPLVFVIVNRHGWWDPRSEVTRSWQRIRPRSGPYAY